MANKLFQTNQRTFHSEGKEIENKPNTGKRNFLVHDFQCMTDNYVNLFAYDELYKRYPGDHDDALLLVVDHWSPHLGSQYRIVKIKRDSFLTQMSDSKQRIKFSSSKPEDLTVKLQLPFKPSVTIIVTMNSQFLSKIRTEKPVAIQLQFVRIVVGNNGNYNYYTNPSILTLEELLRMCQKMEEEREKSIESQHAAL